MRVPGSLSNRIFIASALLAALTIGAALWFVRARLTSEAEQALERDLQTVAGIVDQQQAGLFDTFRRAAMLLADQPRFKAAVDTGDPPTVQPIAEEYREQIGADLLMVHNRRGARLAAAGEDDAGVVRVVEVPIQVGDDRLGVLTVGYRLDEARARDLRTLTGAEIAFAADGVVQASTLGVASFATLGGVAADTRSRALRLDDGEYVALARPLHPETAGRPASVIVMHSRTARMQTVAAIQTFLLALALGSMLLAVAFSYAVARTVTRPLARITDHMRQVAASGDLTRTLALSPSTGWYDEDTQVLARTFDQMTAAIARFQHEAAQRERLSALGRLSTVIAHEVRNPLMIIKGALRGVTRAGATPDDLVDAAGDIDQEVARLNRLVNDVLDFARPIQFERVTTDVNAVCDAAARAVAGDGPGAPTLDLDAGLPRVVTDAERLRTVLVNLLTNAQQAMERRPVSSDSAIVLRTRHEGDRVIITVRDQGPGIAADDLPRIFDPYFTTRRGGTGLGLAISKNIVEGLGGTLRVASQPGAGAEFRIEFVVAPATEG